MADGTFDSLTATFVAVSGARTNLNGFDGAGNHWIRIGNGTEPASTVLGFNLQNTTFLIGSSWTPVISGARLNLNGVDDAGNFWIRVGNDSESISSALGFNLQAKTVIINGGWTAQLGGGLRFPDGTVQSTATVQGPRGPGGPQGPAGASLPGTVLAGTDVNGAGQLRILTASGGVVAAVGADVSTNNTGLLGVLQGGDSNFKAAMYVQPNGNGIVAAAVKTFRIAHPTQLEHEIVYACLEGPEVAAYVRGTGRLIRGACTIDMPDHFLSVVKIGITVSVTPLSAKSQGLAVTSKGPDKFVVEELHGGSGTYDFDWEVKGVRQGHETHEVVQPQLRLS